MMAYGFSRHFSHHAARAFAAVCSVLFLLFVAAACDGGGVCVATEDLEGEWKGTYNETGGPSEMLELLVTDNGASFSGTYTISDGTSGQLSGLQSASNLVFTAQHFSGECDSELTGSAQVCGNSLTYQLKCDGEPAASGTLTRKLDDKTGDTCRYALDGECDEPTLCDRGTDTSDCEGETCAFVNDGVCDEPEGTSRCMDGSDVNDCAQTCPFINNGVCNEPEGTNQCAEGTDVNDCGGVVMGCSFQGDGVCDEPEGTGRCAEGFDPFDCSPRMGCPFTNDGVCDEPEGTGRCFDGDDFSDCNFNICMPVNDGVCDEPEGTNICPEGTDFNDCASCSRMNDGVCDEPEGTGQCAEGSDLNDCASSEIVCGSTTCSVLDPSGLGLLDACCTVLATCGIAGSTGVCTPLEAAQEGSCEPYETPLTANALAACCLPSGQCGVDLSSDTNDCVPVEVFPILALDAVPCDQDQDGGVE